MVEEIQENYRKNGAGLCVFDWVYFKEAGQNNSIYLLIETDDKLSPLNSENEFKQPDYIMKAKAKPPGKKMLERKQKKCHQQTIFIFVLKFILINFGIVYFL